MIINNRYTLAICDGHNASVALSKNGKVEFAISEERLTRIKNHFGWPAMSIDHVNKNYVNKKDIDEVVLYREEAADYLAFLLPEHISSNALKWIWKKSITRLALRFRKFMNNRFFKGRIALYYSRKLGIPVEKIKFLNHHRAHAFAAFSEIDMNDRSWLHFVFDAEGDGDSTSIFKSSNYEMSLVSSCNRHNSLGHFYSQITSHLGMKPNQHEFKVMGLEPYADRGSKGFQSCYQKFSDIIAFEAGQIKFKISPATRNFSNYLKSHFYGERFDNVAAAAQVILEDLVIEYVKFWIQELSIFNISLSGGVAMNVKLMQRLYDIPDIEEIYIVPSSGDESCVIGCLNFGSVKNMITPTKLSNLYLGVERNFDAELDKVNNQRSGIQIEFHEQIEDQVAQLLNQGKVVARVCGRDEFGARALGNRSIMANPNDSSVIDLINKQVKNRDFWMPFTPSILYEKKDQLVINPRKYDAFYMNITFNSRRTISIFY